MASIFGDSRALSGMSNDVVVLQTLEALLKIDAIYLQGVLTAAHMRENGFTGVV